jgi:hypothetical protein
MTESDETARLRARVAELEAQTAATGRPDPPAEPVVRRSAWWALGSAVLVTLACVLAPISVASVWASTVLSDTDQYVETVAPLADDPAVQKAVADDVTAAVVESLDVDQVTADLLDTLASLEDVPPRVAAALPGLAVPITNGVESFTRDQVDNVLASPQFAALWEQTNRIAHEQVVKLLEGNEGGAVSAQGDTITLNLAPVIQEVKQRLVAQGFSLAENIPVVDRQFVLVQSGSISDAQGFYQLLNTLGVWLPLVTLALFAGGVALARDRRRTLVKGALGVAGAMIALGVALALARLWYVGATPANILTEDAAGNVFDTLVRFLRTGVRSLGVLALVVALAALLSGPSTGAVRTRKALTGGIGSLRGGAEAAGWNTGRFGTWTYAHKTGIRVSVFIAGGLVLMFWTRPSAWVVVGTAVVVVLALALVEFLATPTAAAPAGAGGSAAPTMPQQPQPPAAETVAAEQAAEGSTRAPEEKVPHG